MKNYLLVNLLFLFFCFSTNAQTVISNGANSITLDASTQDAGSGSDLTVVGTTGTGRSRLQVIPSQSDNRAFIEVFTAADKDNAGLARLGARDKFGVLSVQNTGTPTTKLSAFAIELNSQADGAVTDPTFLVTTGGFVGTTFGGAETVLMKVNPSGVSTIEAKVQATVTPPDYVFKEDYNLRSLDDVEKYIKQNSHLPEIPSAAEFEANGIKLGKMSFDLLKKVEELTLYMIDMKKENEALKLRISNLEKTK